MTATAPLRAGIYCRVSDPKQEANYSLPTQEAAGRAMAAAEGATVVEAHVYREMHTGVELWERPELTKLRAAIRAQAIDVLYCHAIDRLARDPVHLGVILSEAEHAGVEVRFVTEPLDDSDEGQLIRFVRGYAAKVEHTKFKERSMRGRMARLAAGKCPVGPRPPYGHRWADEAKSRLVEDPATAPIVRRIFRDAAAGVSARQIALALTAEGVSTATGKAFWTGATVVRILRHPVYVGEVRANRWESGRVKGKGKAWRERPADEHLVIEGAADALVSRGLAAAAQARIAGNQQASTRNNRDPEATLLRAGFAVCGYCGKTLRVEGRKRRYYACHVNNQDRYGCPPFSISARTLDAAVWSRVETVLTRPEVIAREVGRLQRDDPTAADLAAVDRRLAEVERRQRNLLARLADEEDADVAALVQADLRALAATRRQLQEERGAVLAQRAGWERAQERLADIESWCRNVAANLGDLTYDQKRLALSALGAQARVWRSDHDPRYAISLDVYESSQTSL